MGEVKVMKKQKFTLEYEVKSSPKILFNYLSNASALEGWFADRVTIQEGDFIFHWGHQEQRASIVTKKENQMIRYKWITEDKKDETYFQFDIIQDELTGDVGLVITDFTTDGEKDEDVRLWNSQVHELMHAIGS
jgi:uncharacterized protein YndB with AHSA1/START domain